MPQVYVAIGSNIEPERRVVEAARLLRARFPGVRFSCCYRNAAVGFAGADFLNAVATFAFDGSLEELVATLHDIEERCGRRRDDAKWAPRAMDLDVLLYGDEVRSTASARVPRQDLLRRAYMLLPLVELAPTLRHPVAGRSMTELAGLLPADTPPLQKTPLDLAIV
jgi:2-amino-4-hydroxy-6-hydroxymethyldihydropteridine diphosphokinase